MITELDARTLPTLRNSALRAYAERYVNIEADYVAQVRAMGIELDPCDYAAETAERLERLKAAGAHFRNDGKSIVATTLSPACVACQQGIGSATFFASLKCHRDCFYCFNPNQEGYAHFLTHQRDLPAELEELSQSGQRIAHIALTGGEPLLHQAEAVAFFRVARAKFPAAHTRLYTTGDQLTPELAAALSEAGLDEIRFSLRMHDLERGHRHTFDRIALARPLIPSVMVEMPVLPGTLAAMRAVLVELDRLGVDSINLLELCYPFNQTEAFTQRGYQVRARPFRVLYNYWYGGGLPIARSELECLDLVLFALEQGLKLGVHYCSVENKHTGQVYQQNAGAALPGTHVFSQRDYFIKTARLMGRDVRRALRALAGAPAGQTHANVAETMLEVHPRLVPQLAGLGAEVGLSYNVMEERADGPVMRELKVALVRPESFDPEHDL